MSEQSTEARDEEILCIVTSALRDLSEDWPAQEIVALDGEEGLKALLRGLVTELRGRGINDEGGWDCDVTKDIPVVEGAHDQSADIDKIAIATTGLRDLYMGYRPRDIVALDGSSGLDNLVRGLVTELRGRGIDDDGGWNCDATAGIPVARTVVLR